MKINRREAAKLAAAAVGASAAPARAQSTSTAPGTVHLPARDISPPPYLSAEAKAFLTMTASRPRPAQGATIMSAEARAVAERTQAQMMEQMFDGANGAFEDLQIDGVHLYSIEPAQWKLPAGSVYLDFHGGGLTSGGGDMCRLLGQITARNNGIKVWAVDYGMPPERPFPAGLDDGLKAYRALLRQYRPEHIIVGGASAGGNLAAATLLRAREEGLPMPAACALISPELDLTESGDSFRTNAGLDILGDTLMQANLAYANGHDLNDPHVSPVLGDVRGFPPTLITAGSREIFLSNAIRMHRALRSADVYAELHILEVGGHQGLSGRSPEDTAMGRDVHRFLKAALTQPARRVRSLQLDPA